MPKVRVLVIDDSASVRQTLVDVLSADPGIEVMGVASDPFVAARRIAEDVPDVITLDVEMPRMDGITFLRKLMAQRPIPVVMCSSLTEAGSETLMQALEAGAVDIILKPRIGAADHLAESADRIRDVVKAAARARLGARRTTTRTLDPGTKLTADAMLPPPTGAAMARTTEMVACLGASTGGTEAKEDQNGDPVLRGHVLIAPGDKHMLLERQGARYQVAIKDGPPVSRHRPSVDVLFRSAARAAGRNAMGVIMTGMGDDGARGLLELKEAGAVTVAQDEATSIVFGMPKEAIARGAAQKVTALEHIAREIMNVDRSR